MDVQTTKANPRVPLTLGWWLVIAGIIGTFASAVLTIDKIRMLEDPTFSALCDINNVFACGDVMRSAQSEALGIPNSILGLVGFGGLAAIGVGIIAGGRYKAWLWFIMQLGMTIAVLFVHWFVYQAAVELRALCIYCMVVWSISIPTFVYVTAYNMREFGGVAARPMIRHCVAWGWVLLVGLFILWELRTILFA